MVQLMGATWPFAADIPRFAFDTLAIASYIALSLRHLPSLVDYSLFLSLNQPDKEKKEKKKKKKRKKK